MTILWPWLLLSLILIPLLLAAYIWMLRRKRKFAVRYSSLSLIRAALPEHNRWRQHLPFGLFLLGLAMLLFGLSRPVAELEIPLSRTTIILALDVSLSMCATDVEPNRLTIAQEAMEQFVANQADGTQIGIVAFAGFAEIVVPPTTDKDQLQQAIANLSTSIGTAIGSATLKSVDAIAEINPAVPRSGPVLLTDPEAPTDQNANIYQPDIIVLLTDGANSRGPRPLDAAQQAAERGVRVYTIGFGTSNPMDMVCSREQLGSEVISMGFGGNFMGGLNDAEMADLRQFLRIDEDTLQGVADLTGGEYYRAESADQLFEVFTQLPTQIVLQKEQIEISVAFAILGALLVTAGIGLSTYWNRYP